MSLRKNTRKQHFISQTEQRLNAINPNAENENQKIFRFDIEDREQYRVKKGKQDKIKKNLSMDDLFSFHVLNKNDRYNLEALFGHYEAQVAQHTNKLLEKMANPASDLKEEIIQLFLCKFLNFIRNPYSIKKILNTFPDLHEHHPVNASYQQDLNLILSGKKPHQKHRCAELGISDEDYINWLKTIFLLTSRYAGQFNLMENTVAAIFNHNKTDVFIGIYQYSNQTCLLSDRGFTTPNDSRDIMSFDFNLNKNAFIRYTFLDIHSHAPSGIHKDTIDRYLNRKKETKVQIIKDDLEKLEAYNKLTLYQSAHNVFCASDSPVGILVS